MTWERITRLPASYLFEDEYGNVRRISAESGEFISGTWPPSYGQWGYGETIDLDVTVSE